MRLYISSPIPSALLDLSILSIYKPAPLSTGKRASHPIYICKQPHLHRPGIFRLKTIPFAQTWGVLFAL